MTELTLDARLTWANHPFLLKQVMSDLQVFAGPAGERWGFTYDFEKKEFRPEWWEYAPQWFRAGRDVNKDGVEVVWVPEYDGMEEGASCYTLDELKDAYVEDRTRWELSDWLNFITQSEEVLDLVEELTALELPQDVWDGLVPRATKHWEQWWAKLQTAQPLKEVKAHVDRYERERKARVEKFLRENPGYGEAQ